MNVQLPLVVSDITGVTGLRILRDIVAGQCAPHHLAQYRDLSCRGSEAEIVAAQTGNYRLEHLFVLSRTSNSSTPINGNSWRAMPPSTAICSSSPRAAHSAPRCLPPGPDRNPAATNRGANAPTPGITQKGPAGAPPPGHRHEPREVQRDHHDHTRDQEPRSVKPTATGIRGPSRRFRESSSLEPCALLAWCLSRAYVDIRAPRPRAAATEQREACTANHVLHHRC